MDETEKYSLVGRIVVWTQDGRDLSNSFCLVVAEDEWEATLVPLVSETEWGSGDYINWGLERPRAHSDPATELAACDRLLLAKKQFLGGKLLCLRADGLDYHVWEGTPKSCRYL